MARRRLELADCERVEALRKAILDAQVSELLQRVETTQLHGQQRWVATALQREAGERVSEGAGGEEFEISIVPSVLAG